MWMASSGLVTCRQEYPSITRLCELHAHKCLHYANMRSNVAHVKQRRVASAATTNAKAPGFSASNLVDPLPGAITVRDALIAGGLLGLKTKEILR